MCVLGPRRDVTSGMQEDGRVESKPNTIQASRAGPPYHHVVSLGIGRPQVCTKTLFSFKKIQFISNITSDTSLLYVYVCMYTQKIFAFQTVMAVNVLYSQVYLAWAARIKVIR
jgi:hypothetical protein